MLSNLTPARQKVGREADPQPLTLSVLQLLIKVSVLLNLSLILSILTTIVFFVAGPWALAAVIPLYQEANAYLETGVLPPEKEDRIDEIRRFLWPHFLENPQDFQQNGPQDEKKDRSHIARHPGKHANEKRVKKDHHRRKRPGLKIRH